MLIKIEPKLQCGEMKPALSLVNMKYLKLNSRTASDFQNNRIRYKTDKHGALISLRVEIYFEIVQLTCRKNLAINEIFRISLTPNYKHFMTN